MKYAATLMLGLFVVLLMGCGSAATGTTPTTPTGKVSAAVQKIVGDRAISKKIAYDSSTDVADIAYQCGDNCLAIYLAKNEIVKVAKAVVGAEPKVQVVNIDIYTDATDTYGNTKNEDGIKVQLKRATIDEINADNFNADNLPKVADFYQELVKF